ncbi:MAG: nucleoside triphosphate pyrophosphohydrolase [Clostridia bacterium]|nr:nucleoside triphosphate pyrophosphohydrolase [Clostridia bacterium]
MDKKYTIEDLKNIIVTLRSENGCPWDKVQTHQSIKKSLIEECYEAIDALDNGTDKDFANELGDVLLQVVFHARMAQERGAFDFDDILYEICNKLISRHTHVFGEDKAGNEEEALYNWEKNKKKEKGLRSNTEALLDVPNYLPSLMRAEKLIKKAKDFNYEEKDTQTLYSDIQKVLLDIKEEEDTKKAQEMYGKLLFDVTALGRSIGVTPEIALSEESNKFIERFSKLEKN